MWIKKRVKKVCKVYQIITGCKIISNISSSQVEFLFPDGFGFRIYKK